MVEIVEKKEFFIVEGNHNIGWQLFQKHKEDFKNIDVYGRLDNRGLAVYYAIVDAPLNSKDLSKLPPLVPAITKRQLHFEIDFFENRLRVSKPSVKGVSNQKKYMPENANRLTRKLIRNLSNLSKKILKKELTS